MAQEWALRHTERRLEAEVKQLIDLVGVVATIMADVRHPRSRTVKPMGKLGDEAKSKVKRR